ncbi:futalosine hydrolase [Deinococcus metallilatus]|uniref:Futalosine hydrolase n=1 Tax=Deinococcus metallilatus TaxID=1211322 RepID=A0AAJ5F2W5_9DEIO|nr:futalosine hydrolase [Deinococcus metallilatus]MBB5295416.1 futalosine hydrolase [Deinococcus metallilatus]QBY08059.1 futalosine hydrolase [Deinococcus metallilatus]RXJ12952.1 futalosine hydrolase [Deinococcus metallilatus]TLK27126.1 futalosine hydrolase [Deinococcus metallilatus]GMA16093.1 Futalosine hydrolase [Deinococcus metallilatus]
MNVLIVVATAGEAARLADLPARVEVSGVGPVAAALATQRALTRERFDLAVSAGIGGAYPGSGLNPGDLAVSSVIVQADLGARDGERFLDLAALGLSVLPDAAHPGIFPAWDGAARLASAVGAACGPTLTLSTVTGTAERAAELARRYPGALTEGMEGAGVAHAALLAGVPALEVRGVSNPVGPRDRSTWCIPEALAATRRGLEVLLAGL